MIEELLGIVGRPWILAAAGIAAVVGTKTGRKLTRTVVKSAVHAGAVVEDSFKSVSARVQEEFSDVVAEAKAEMSEKKAEHKSGEHKKKKHSD